MRKNPDQSCRVCNHNPAFMFLKRLRKIISLAYVAFLFCSLRTYFYSSKNVAFQFFHSKRKNAGYARGAGLVSKTILYFF
jgi:hypothetical protein